MAFGVFLILIDVGLVVSPGKSYSQTIESPFRLTGVSLGPAPETDERATLMLRIGQSEFAICSLVPNKIEQQMVDLVFAVGEAITFYVSGSQTFHLTGNYIDEEADEDDEELAYGYDDLDDFDDEEDDDEEDEDDEDEDDDDEGPVITELDSEDEEDEESEEEPQAKRPSKPEPKKEVKKAKIEPVKKEEPKKAQEQKKPEEKKKPEQAKKEAPQSPKKEQVKKDAPQSPKKELAKPEAKKEQPKPQQAAASKPEKKTLPSGLVLEDIKTGDGKKVKAGRKVGIYYIGKLANGKVFDKCQNGKPFTFTPGKGEVIKGMDMGVQGMAVGGERKITIPGDLAYGKKGSPPTIPPNSALTFEIKVVEIQ